MLSSLLEGWIQLEKARLNKLKADIKKEIKKAEKKAEEESKNKEKDKETNNEKDKETSKTDVKKDAKKEAKKSNKVRALKVKEIALKAKIAVINVFKIVVTVIEQFIMLLISILGPIGLLVIMAVALLMLIIYGFLHLDFSTPDTTFYNPGVQNENCIQGNQAIANIGYNSGSVGQLQGTLTEYEKQLLNTLHLYDDILSKPSNTVFVNPSSLEEVKGILGKDKIVHYLFGMGSTTSEFKIGNGPNGTSGSLNEVLDIFKYPSKLAPTNDKVFLGLHSNNTFNGEYVTSAGSQTVLIDSFVTDWKDTYIPSENTAYDMNFIPYGVATHMGALISVNLPSKDTIKDTLNNVMSQYGIVANTDELTSYCQLFLDAAHYNGNGDDSDLESLLSLWCGLWSATSTTDIERNFDKIKITDNGFNNGQNLSENNARTYIIGGTEGYKEDTIFSSMSYFEVNNVKIDVPLWKWVYENCSNQEYFTNTALVWLNNSTVTSEVSIINGHSGVLAYLMGYKVSQGLGTSMPIVTGGSIDNCDCYDGIGGSGSIGGSGNFQDLSSIKAGEIQGDWPDDVKEKMMSYGWNQWFGTSYAITNPDIQIVKSNVSFEEWRQSSKWKVPFQVQYSAKEPWASSVQFGNIKYYNACHIYMSSYIASALTGKFINVPEMFAALRATEGVVVSGSTKGYYNNAGANKTFEKLGIYWTGMYADGTVTPGSKKSDCPIVYPVGNSAVEKINAVLDAGGLVGVYTNGGNYTGSGHYFAIIERNGDQYKTFSANSGTASTHNDIEWHSLDYIIGTNGKYLGTTCPFFLAYKPGNTSLNTSISSSSSDIEVIDIPQNLPQSGISGVSESYVSGWSTTAPSAKVKKTWELEGCTSDRNIDTIDGYYLVAVSEIFGVPSDLIGVVLEDGTVINCIIGDRKGGEGNACKYGHLQGVYTSGDYTEVDSNYMLEGAKYSTRGEISGLKLYQFNDSKKYFIKIYVWNDKTGDNMRYEGETSLTDSSLTKASVNILEWIVPNGAQEDLTGWNNKRIVRVINYGQYITGDGERDYSVSAKIQKTSNVSPNVICTPKDSQSTIAGTFQETPGKFQGLWANDLNEHIDEYIDLLSMSDGRKALLKSLVQYVGTKPIVEGKDFYKYQQDKWVSYNGKGAVRYNQGHAGINEKWGDYNYKMGTRDFNSGSFVYSACGCYSTAFAASTILGKYINPPELMLAAMTYKIRDIEKYNQLSAKAKENVDKLVHGGSGDDGTSVFSRDIIAPILNELGLKATQGGFNIDAVDDCLNNNGVVIACTTVNNGLGKYFSSDSGGHYIVIREKTNLGYLIYSSTHWNIKGYSGKIPNREQYVDREFTGEQIKTMFTGPGNLVYVKP